jgi:hypothetical protein
MTIALGTISIVLAFAICYFGLRRWRRGSGADSLDRSSGFRPRIGFTRLDGMESLSLLLPNETRTHVWAEEIEIFLTELVANDQTAEPSFHGTQKIRQMIPPGDLLPISLAEVIYKAAGEPQRKHSSILSSVVRYRIGEKWLEKNLEVYRIQMNGLTASGVQKVRKSAQPLQPHKDPIDTPVMATKLR